MDTSDMNRTRIHRVLVHSRRIPIGSTSSYALLWLESVSCFNSVYLGWDGAMAASATTAKGLQRRKLFMSGNTKVFTDVVDGDNGLVKAGSEGAGSAPCQKPGSRGIA